MLRNLLTFACFSACLALPVAAEPLGWSLGISNDSIGEARDRWQSSSVQFSVVTGDDWTGSAPGVFGRVLEYRLRSDILTPESLDAPEPDDRRHAGILAFGLHSHSSRGPAEMRLGADIVAVGPQTGLLDLQEELHEILGFTIPRLDDFQIGNAVRLQLSTEIGRTWQVDNWAIRPFVELQAGPEDLVRAGIDVTWGAFGRGDLLTRATTTGHRLRSVDDGKGGGVSLVLGADAAQVRDSLYLPADLGYRLTPVRTRLRAGIHADWKRLDAYYGLTWLGPEFEAQREGQFVGTLQLGLRF